jgi:hypothetical protein
MRWLKQKLRQELLPQSHDGTASSLSSLASAPSGGYTWSCGGMSATSAWIVRPDVRKALHLSSDSAGSRFSYSWSGPASITLWPFLATKLRVLIYNGDADVRHHPSPRHAPAVTPLGALASSLANPNPKPHPSPPSHRSVPSHPP